MGWQVFYHLNKGYVFAISFQIHLLPKNVKYQTDFIICGQQLHSDPIIRHVIVGWRVEFCYSFLFKSESSIESAFLNPKESIKVTRGINQTVRFVMKKYYSYEWQANVYSIQLQKKKLR